jgi:O-antigen/teichoic acid export membrane protein
MILILPHNACQLLLVLFGPWLISTIYPTGYHQAGWMLSALSMGAVAGIVNSTYGNAFMAIGTTLSVTIGVASQLVVVVSASLIGFYLAGQMGYIYGLATVQWILYPVYAGMAIRAGIWQPRIDLPILGVGGAICLAVLLR